MQPLVALAAATVWAEVHAYLGLVIAVRSSPDLAVKMSFVSITAVVEDGAIRLRNLANATQATVALIAHFSNVSTIVPAMALVTHLDRVFATMVGPALIAHFKCVTGALVTVLALSMGFVNAIFLGQG